MPIPPASDAAKKKGPAKFKRVRAREPAAFINQRGRNNTTGQRRNRGGSVDERPIYDDETALLLPDQAELPEGMEALEEGLQPLGGPPPHWKDSPKYLAAWDEAVRLAHKGVLTENDRVIMEMLATLLVIGREKGWENLSSAQFRQVERTLAYLGMTPAHRSYVKPAFAKTTTRSAYDE